MAETFAKKEKEKKRAKKKMEKAEKKEERKTNNNKGKTLEDMIAYVDEYGNITNVPPDKQKRQENSNTEAYIKNTRTQATDENIESTGIVSLFFKDKGYGFITEDETSTSIFVHSNNLTENIRENDKVSFTKELSPKGPVAINVKRSK